MTEANIPLGTAFAKCADTPEFANLLGSMFGKLHEGISTIENELDINDLNKLSTDDNINIEKLDVENSSTDDNVSVEDRSDILDCEISSANDDIEIINFKITELNNSIMKVFTDKNGNTITDVLSTISENLKILVNNQNK